MKNIAIVRDRGQLTIPESIRNTTDWMAPMSVVDIYITKPFEITIKPHSKSNKKELNWDEIEKVRSMKGRGKVTMSTSEFLEIDRKSH